MFSNCLCVCTWTAAGQPSKFRFSDDQKTLTVSSVCKNDCGGPNDVMVIQCNASNTHGYVLGSGYINVFGQFCSVVHSTSLSVIKAVKRECVKPVSLRLSRLNNTNCSHRRRVETRLVSNELS